MAKNDTEKILEAIHSLKKEQEKEIQLLKIEQEKIRKENQEIKNLLKKSMSISNDNYQEYNKNSETQSKNYNKVTIDKNATMAKIDFEEMDKIISADKISFEDEMDFTPKELYSISQINTEMDNLDMSIDSKKSFNQDNIENELFKRDMSSNNAHDDERDDMSIISFLARSDKRVQILKSLNNSDKIPSMISKEIGDSSHHVSKYLKTLKEKGLVVCLNEDDKRFRFYSITSKGKKYLKIIQEENY